MSTKSTKAIKASREHSNCPAERWRLCTCLLFNGNEDDGDNYSDGDTMYLVTLPSHGHGARGCIDDENGVCSTLTAEQACPKKTGQIPSIASIYSPGLRSSR